MIKKDYSLEEVRTIAKEIEFRETWYLLVPVGCRSLLSAEEVVRLYRERVQIE